MGIAVPHNAHSVQIRLLDFNPVGGATSPLLFTWEELGYPENSPSDHPEPHQAQSASAEPRLAQLNTEHAAEGNEASSGLAARETEAAHEAPHSMSGQADSAAAVSQDTLQHAKQATDNSAGNGNGNGHGCSVEHAEILVRFAEPGSSMLRPASALYGAPYDMADLSEGSAISEMLRKMETQEQSDTQEQCDLHNE